MKQFKVFGNNVYKLFNPTSMALVMKYDGREIELKAFEEMEVESRPVHRFFLKKYKERGIVDVTYDQTAQKKYPNQQDFFNARCLEGLKALRAFFANTLAREQQAASESSLKNGSALDNLLFKTAQFKNDLESVDTAIQKFLKENTAPEAKKTKNESSSNKNQSQAQAG